jgi:hypothetical protein
MKFAWYLFKIGAKNLAGTVIVVLLLPLLPLLWFGLWACEHLEKWDRENTK